MITLFSRARQSIAEKGMINGNVAKYVNTEIKKFIYGNLLHGSVATRHGLFCF